MNFKYIIVLVTFLLSGCVKVLDNKSSVCINKETNTTIKVVYNNFCKDSRLDIAQSSGIIEITAIGKRSSSSKIVKYFNLYGKEDFIISINGKFRDKLSKISNKCYTK